MGEKSEGMLPTKITRVPKKSSARAGTSAQQIALSGKGGICLPCRIAIQAMNYCTLTGDLPRFGLFRFGYANLEYAIFVGSFDAVGFRGLGQ